VSKLPTSNQNRPDNGARRKKMLSKRLPIKLGWPVKRMIEDRDMQEALKKEALVKILIVKSVGQYNQRTIHYWRSLGVSELLFKIKNFHTSLPLQMK
jgi:hypothetical protein